MQTRILHDRGQHTVSVRDNLYPKAIGYGVRDLVSDGLDRASWAVAQTSLIVDFEKAKNVLGMHPDGRTKAKEEERLYPEHIFGLSEVRQYSCAL